MNLLIFTDLDGTLLNHGDYSHGEAEDIELLNLKEAPHPGSRGWNHVMVEILNRFEG